jgi:hypothetical protein
MDFLCAVRQLGSRGRFSASEIKMGTKTHIQKVSGQPGNLTPEISLIAMLARDDPAARARHQLGDAAGRSGLHADGRGPRGHFLRDPSGSTSQR